MRWFKPAAGSSPLGRRATSRGICALVLAFLILGTIYSVVTPLFEASDELWHYPFVKHLADGHWLPVQDPANQGPWRQEGSQPPLYYGLAALITRWVPSDDLPQVMQRNPHADIGLIRPDGNANMVIHTPRESWPYRGAVLAVHLARGFSVLLGALTVLFTYLLGLEVVPERPELALAAAAVVAFTPMFLFISGSVNNDNLLVTLSTASLWLLVRQLRLPPSPARWALVGTVVGLAALSKVSGLALAPLVALALAWTAWRRRDWRVLIWGGACAAGAAALVAGWWYYRNWRLYHDPLGFSVFVAIVGPRVPQPTLRQLLGEWKGFVMAYWAFFGGVNVAAPAWFYRLCNGLALLGLGGLLFGAARRLWRRQWPDPDTAFRLALVAVWPLLVMAGLVRWTMMTIASQGRLIFPAIASLSYLMVLGFDGWGNVKRETSNVKRDQAGAARLPDGAAAPVPSSADAGPADAAVDVAVSGRPAAWRLPSLGTTGAASGRPLTFDVSRLTFHVSRLAYLPPILLAACALWLPFGVIAPAYARPPLLTAAQQASIPERLDLTLGEQMELLGYRIEPEEVRPGQEVAVTLYWRAVAPMPSNYSVFVHLLTDNDLIVGQRDLYPGRGSFPTTLWQPGDAIADTYVIPVSPTTFSPSRAQVEVGLYRAETGERLPIRNGEGRTLGDNVRFGEVLVRSEPRDGIANPVWFNLGGKAALVGYDLDRTALPAGETLHLTLYWKALASFDHDYTVFAHVLGPENGIWAQKDAWPGAGAAPTSGWQPGQLVEDHYELVVKPETPSGVYELEIGMYLGETGDRLPVLAPDGRVQDNRVLLNRVRVLRP